MSKQKKAIDILKLNKREKAFVKEFLIDLNYTKAATRAGYSKKTAGQKGYSLFKKIEIQYAIEEAMAERSKRTEITQDMVLKEFAKLGFASMGDFVEFYKNKLTIKDSKDLTADQLSAISEITSITSKDGKHTLRFKLHNKRDSLADIAKHLGMFTDKVELTGSVKYEDLSDDQLESLILRGLEQRKSSQITQTTKHVH